MVKKKVRIHVTIDSDILKIMNEERGLTKLSTYVDYLLKKQLLPKLKERGV